MNPAPTLVAALVLTATPALADTVRWINPAGGSFEDSANWDRLSPPGNMDTALFDIAGAYTVTLSTDHVVNIMYFTRGDVTVNLGTHWLSAGSPQFYGGMSVLPTPGEPMCAARFVGGTVPLWGLGVGAGAIFSADGTHMSDTLGPGTAGATYSQGATVLISNGGVVNTETGDIHGATIVLSSSGVLTAQFLQTSLPSNITVTGANSNLRAEDALSVSGTLHVTNGGQVAPFNGHVVMTNCQATIEGTGSVLDAYIDADADSTVLVRDGGSFHSPGTSTIHGSVNFDQGGIFYGSALLDGPCAIDIDSTLTFGYMYFSAPITVVLDGLSARATPLFSSGNPSMAMAFTGPLTIALRNPNALRNGRVVQIAQHSAHDFGAFSSLIAPTINGGRSLTMTQTSSDGGIVNINVVPGGDPCWSADFDGDGDTGTDFDIEAFFACFAGNCCPACGSTDINSDGDASTDADIEAFFRVLAGGTC
jgi:hypothetical protein